ncbi:hypothetical protein [Zhouia amylolytica]|uniref:Phenol degradation protein meta n=1 Tax=Zhouia amylolytica AD3 TaxID=1286632 RepID=W2UJ68_9FLAO|nr:hypothetical protein [Zhouia amylolytica]ETN94195.1 hypothetical protein P278_29990 [Zhouia amylolytica AD3]
MLKNILLIICCWLLSLNIAEAQGYGKSDNPAYKAYYDSIQQMEYDYTFPILGKQAYKRGYDIPFPWGVSAIYFTQKQEINITQTAIGFNGSNKVDISNFINFGPTIATTNAYTVRPDLWIFPFLNIYGILGGGTTETEVTLLDPISLQTDQHFGAKSFGLGATLAGAVGPIWIAWDNNYNFVDVDVIVEPVPAFNSSLRIGHSFMDPIKPTRSLSVWSGVFYQSLQSDTEGSIAIQNIFPNIGDGNIIEDMYRWAETLPPAQKFVVNKIINKMEDIANGIDPGNANIDYKLEKEVAAPFNLILGAQYQFNKHWQLRSELGVFGKRSQFLLNLNYRFQGF